MFTTFSIKRIRTDYKSVFRRFPATLCALVAQSVFNILLVTEAINFNQNDELIMHIWTFLAGLFAVCFGYELLREDQLSKLRKPTVLVCLIAAYAAIFALSWWSETLIAGSTQWELFMFNTAAIGVICCGIVFFLPSSRTNDDNEVMPLVKSIFINLFIANLLTAAIYGVWCFVLYCSNAIFEESSASTEYIVWAVLIVQLIGGWLFLFSLPTFEQRHERSDKDETVSEIVKSIVLYILLPLVMLFILIMLVYAMHILIRWELPKARLSVIVSIVMAVYVFIYTAIFRQISILPRWANLMLTKYIPMTMLPLAVLMTAGIIRRFSDYGITPYRLYILTVNAWYYFVCLYILLSKRKSFRTLYLSFTLLFCITTLQPMNYFNITRLVRTKQTTSLLKQYSNKSLPLTYSEYHDVLMTMPIGESEKLEDGIDYLYGYHNDKSNSYKIVEDIY